MLSFLLFFFLKIWLNKNTHIQTKTKKIKNPKLLLHSFIVIFVHDYMMIIEKVEMHNSRVAHVRVLFDKSLNRTRKTISHEPK
ncbi:hypothetical protein AQUCO_00100413v1 [Aquilegia coerulea]|uniref:Uncharacterized protein n=1 Tax=Aquilegia coerulea TaxID=218851 RepID=A0A2G5FA86_AQUCA|nr:hypothetical protein AQUCO_00100413v1 [Aquilegia coerulea]